ncbi:helix-turn-helix transcriptional regulator [Candidatus Roizmanbacteria bacterium]|jgi:transcriptional regulator with XRE-family HTH domain|nr:helix-turn-helix transcriptional regulator [Candidatus Roizmanbacteria bacterium]
MKGDFFYLRLGEKVIDIRKRKQITQEQLAFSSDLDRTYIARIERGRANPSIKTLHKICKALRVKLSKLFRGV